MQNPQITALPVQIQSLTKHFGAVHAVEDVTFDIKAGEFLTLLGPSGVRQNHSFDDDRRIQPTDGWLDPYCRARNRAFAAASLRVLSAWCSRTTPCFPT